MVRTTLCLIALTLSVLVAGCSQQHEQAAPDSTECKVDSATPWVDSVMRTMSLEDRVGQLFMPSAYPQTDEYNMRHLRRYVADRHVGGILFLQGDRQSLASVVDSLQRLSPIPLYMALDAEWGLGMRLSDAPRYPMPGEMPDTTTAQEMYQYGLELANQARDLGLNMLMAPVLDVVPNAGNTVIGKRSFGSEPNRVTVLAIPFARGLEDGGIISVAKHFPGHGAATADSHRTLPVIDRDRNALDSIDFVPFRKYIASGLSAIMVGHLYMPALDNIGRSAAASPEVIEGLLINQLGFNGLIITDALNMKGAQTQANTSIEAILAGADIILSPADTGTEIETVCAAVRQGIIPASRIDVSCRKILLHKYPYRFPVHSP